MITPQLFSSKISVKKKNITSQFLTAFSNFAMSVKQLCCDIYMFWMFSVHSSNESKGFSISISQFIDGPMGAGPISSDIFLLYSKVYDLCKHMEPKFALGGMVMAA